MMGKLLQMIVRNILSHFLQRFHYKSVKRRATLMEQGPISYLSGKSVFERILDFWKKICFIEEFSCLEVRDVTVKVILRQLRNSAQQREGNNHTDNGSSLQEVFFLNRQPIDTIRHDVLHGARNADLIDFQARSVRPLLANQNSNFDKRAHALLCEKRVSFRALNQQFFQRNQVFIAS